MRLRRKSVDIVVTGDGRRARPEADPDADPIEPPDGATTAAPDAAQPSALDPLASITVDATVPVGANGNGANGNGANGNGANGQSSNGPRADVPVGIPFGAAVATFAPPASPTPAPTPSTPAPDPAPVPTAAPSQGPGGVATLAPPLTAAAPPAVAPAAPAAPVAPPAPAAPIAYAAPMTEVAPVAPAAPAAPVAPSAPAAPAAPDPVAAAPVAPAAPAVPGAPAAKALVGVPGTDVVPIVWTAPGWAEFRRRAAAGPAPSAAPATTAPVAPAPHLLTSPLVSPAARPTPVAVPEQPVAIEPAAAQPVAPEPAPPASAEPGSDALGSDASGSGTSAVTELTPENAEDADPTPPPSAPSHLGEMLVSRAMVTREQLDQALGEQSDSGMRIGSQLVAMGFVTERELVSVLAEQLEMRVSDLRLVAPEPEAVALVPEELARRLEIVPVRMTPEGLEVARSDALNEAERKEIEDAVDGTIVPVLATPSEIQRAIDSTYQALAGMAQQVQAYADLASTRTPVETGTQIVVDDRAPVVQVVTLLLTQAVRDRTSDIHIEPQDGDVRVRFRIDGVLREITTIPAAMAQALISRIKVMADMNIVERRRSQDGQITTEIDGRPLDVRVATTATIWGEKAVLRLLDKTRNLLALSDLGMTPDIARQFSELVVSPFGMVICAGPTGSGKTTTLYAALNEINSPERNITTIEDPVEYVLPRINQIQVNRQAGITFADGLKSIMRQDPDVILVGEIRDVETARIAVQSALTGHFVLSSLHATDCATALQRFRDMGIEPFLINSSVLALEAQRLVRRICVHCREPYEPTPAERAFFLQATGVEKETWTHGQGCNLCSHTGYSQRIGVYELMRITEEIQELVLKDAGHDEIQAVASAGGMRTLKDEAVRLVAEDVTTVAEAFRSVYTR